MLLDEATSALDEQVEAALLTELKKLNDKTVIIITHKKQALNICDGQIVFENGKVYQR